MNSLFPLLKPPTGLRVSRYFRRNAGTTDGYETNARLIPDPKLHFDVEFELLGIVGEAGTLISQNLSGVQLQREMQIYAAGGTYNFIIGGLINLTSIAVTPGVWRFKFNNPTMQIFKNEILVSTIAANVGSITEATATTTWCMRHDGTLTSYANHYSVVMANVIFRNSSNVKTNAYDIRSSTNSVPDRINGDDATIINPNANDIALYQQQATGEWLGQELITQAVWESPAIANDQWSFSNNQWVLNGDGANRGLTLLSVSDQPGRMLLSGVLVAISGELAVVQSNNLSVTAIGNYSFEFNKAEESSQQYKRSSGVVSAILDKPSLKEVLAVA
jgi:hypothetical protein